MLNLAYSRGLMNNLDLLSSLINYFSPEGLSTLVIKDLSDLDFMSW